MSLKLVLQLLGLKSHNLLGNLLSLAFAFGSSTLSSELVNVLKSNVTPARRTELVADLRGIADAMEKGNDTLAAQTIVSILQGIRL